MGSLAVVAIGVTVVGVVGYLIVRGRIRRAGPDAPGLRTARRTAIGAIGIGAIVAVVALGISTADTFRRRGLPPPEFPSLTAAPDRTLRGTVAYISEAKSPTAGRQACARVAAASGAASKDVYCWPIRDMALATTVWRPDGRLLVTSFDAPVGKDTLVPKWAKLVDVTTGAIEDVDRSELGDHARPSTGPKRNADGDALVRTGENGNVTVKLTGPSGSRTVFSVKDANPDWGIQTGPVWSPDFAWFLMWDGTRLLLTTPGAKPSTRVLAPEVSGGVFNFDVATFSITRREYPTS